MVRNLFIILESLDERTVRFWDREWSDKRGVKLSWLKHRRLLGSSSSDTQQHQQSSTRQRNIKAVEEAAI